ncbi:hypothetical protein HELRODRAFT_164538 [Helobdella robusta]|uniref:EGF-like domain-containing protein n=1 Tax=Helobdella robusta TaxID=6412 RepID=T1EVK0_HELRO|nr:hypothetical protein HELRODRAFT_164538 [Helobdella robusta]ESN94659.1 hypothetical protein HELRODRAFT_164538 [Helobdella robusta]
MCACVVILGGKCKAERSSTISFLPQLSPPSTSPSSSSTSPSSSSASLSSSSSSSSPSSTASTSTPPSTDQLLYAHRTVRTDLNASLMWMTYADDDITFHVRAICSAKLKGPICSECQPTDNSESGHYRCQEVTEDMECLPGWSDPDNLCRTPICDPACVSGECISPNECSCLPGWKGERCETCVPTLPCHPVNGYCTHPGECLCKPGWGNGIIGCDLGL